MEAPGGDRDRARNETRYLALAIGVASPGINSSDRDFGHRAGGLIQRVDDDHLVGHIVISQYGWDLRERRARSSDRCSIRGPLVVEWVPPDGTGEKGQRASGSNAGAIGYAAEDTRTAVAYNRQPVRDSRSNGDNVGSGLWHVGDRPLPPGQNRPARAEAKVGIGAGSNSDQVAGRGRNAGLIRSISPGERRTPRLEPQVVDCAGRDGRYVGDTPRGAFEA